MTWLPRVGARPLGPVVIAAELLARTRAELPVLAGLGEREELLAAAWLASLRAARTRRAYAGDVRGWLGWLAERGTDVLDAGRVHVDVWAAGQQDQGAEASTVRRRLSALSRFYRYCAAHDLVDRIPTAGVARPMVDPDYTATIGLDRDQTRALVAAADADRDPQALRTAAVIRLLVHNALRVDEACAADVIDLGADAGHRVLRVIRKGARKARIPLTPATAAALDAYLADRARRGGLSDARQLAGPLLATASGCQRTQAPSRTGGAQQAGSARGCLPCPPAAATRSACRPEASKARPLRRGGCAVTSRIPQDGDGGAKARLSMERGAEARLSMESQEAFFTLYWPRLVRFLLTQASNSSLADDVAGDTFLKAWVNWDTLLRCERPDSWLFKVAIRQLRREEAHARSRGSLAEDPIASMGDIRQAAVMDEWVADHLTLTAAVRTLPRRQAEVIACVLVGCPTRETAEILGMTEGTVRSHLCLAQGKLRVLLNDADVPGVARRDTE